MTYSALSQAMQQAGWEGLTSDDGIILSSTTGLIELWEDNLIEYYKQEQSAEQFATTLKYEPLGVLLDSLCEALGFIGPRTLVSTACAASTQAIMMASQWIASGKVKRCIVGGAEVLSSLTVEGFKSLKLISETAAKPFDINRSGINLSEGAAFFCLESSDQSPNAAIAKVVGCGTFCDAYHMTAPHPEGKGCYNSMKLALKQGNVSPDNVELIHTHGTGSGHNDISESTAISHIFRDCKSKPVVFSTKSVHGHALAASGIIESIISVMALNENRLIKTRGLDSVDPAIDSTLKFIKNSDEIKDVNISHVLKTTIGFGGTNAAILFGKNNNEL
jgi:3-oxoacyl-(acyl-carrier-protein) synthase